MNNPMGFILNKPLEVDLSNILTNVTKKIKVYYGGPVSKDTLFCIHKSEIKLKSSKQITRYIRYGCNLNEIITNLENGEINDGNTMFFLGYSGWTNKQLLEEINQNYWKINTEYSKNIFEKSEENLWKKLLEKTGGESYIWSNAPESLGDN